MECRMEQAHDLQTKIHKIEVGSRYILVIKASPPLSAYTVDNIIQRLRDWWKTKDDNIFLLFLADNCEVILERVDE